MLAKDFAFLLNIEWLVGQGLWPNNQSVRRMVNKRVNNKLSCDDKVSFRGGQLYNTYGVGEGGVQFWAILTQHYVYNLMTAETYRHLVNEL